jgi:hypothetical protein
MTEVASRLCGGSEVLLRQVRQENFRTKTTLESWIFQRSGRDVRYPPAAIARRQRQIQSQSSWASFIVETGHLPSWPLIEMRRP